LNGATLTPRRHEGGLLFMSDVREIVKEKYGQAALQVKEGRASCCGTSASSAMQVDPICSNLYNAEEIGQLPEEALLASLGCGNPTALIDLEPGQTVLDLGSGGGIDVLLSARRVGPTGKAYGLDMTDEMLALAHENQKKSGLTNVEFLKGEIEHIPLGDNTVDVILSNCVINLSADKEQVFREAYRVLKPGGRLAVSDVVTRTELPEMVRQSLELWVGCVAGALTEQDYLAQLRAAGFEDVSIEPTRVYQVEDARGFLESQGIDPASLSPELDGAIYSGFVRARKPGKQSCCSPTCCS
jgi:SAM-dependent methyltransferase